MNHRHAVAFALVFAAAQGALAQEQSSVSADTEFGTRYWASTGMTRWGHNAQGANPILGNPTSVLTYENLDANVFELHGRWTFEQAWFVKGNLGIGRINTGNFDDEDFFAGQVKFSDSTSSVRGGRITYGTLDFGRDVWRSRSGRGALGLFAGYQRWSERVDAYGATFTVGGGAEIPNNVPVISNEVIWTSFRLGLAARGAWGRRTRLTGELALVPYTRMRNEDSHYLRQSPSDLGPVPNVINEGSGTGVQAELELRWNVYEHYELGLGARYWRLKTAKGTNRAAGGTFPLVFEESERTGLTLSLSRLW